jgi:hypothetical protein
LLKLAAQSLSARSIEGYQRAFLRFEAVTACRHRSSHNELFEALRIFRLFCSNQGPKNSTVISLLAGINFALN